MSNDIRARQLLHEDEQFRQVFNGECDISEVCLDAIGDIKNNYPHNKTLYIDSNEQILTNLAWRLLGRYIASNTHLTQIVLEGPGITDATIFQLCESFHSSSSLKMLGLCSSNIHINGLRSMLPLLANSPQLNDLEFSGNTNINTECFELLVSTLHNKGIKWLHLSKCSIVDISALERYNLPNLISLCLNDNNIGREGCRVISNQLQKEGSTLRGVYLNNTGMGDEEAELLAASLRHNTKLELITVYDNNGITERGYGAFLKLLNDVSSVESTYHSNYTLRSCILSSLQENDKAELMRRDKTGALILIVEACIDNQTIDAASRANMSPEAVSHAAGKAKVVRSHLNSQTLKKHCQLQGIEYIPGSVFADVEPILLPDILALIGSEHGHSELYTALIQTAPDLMSYIDRKALIRDVIAKNTARATALAAEYEQKMAALKTEFLGQTAHITAENNGLSNRLVLIELGDSKQTETRECNGDKGEVGGRGNSKKRGRERGRKNEE